MAASGIRLSGDQKRASYDIFISHNRADADWVALLSDALAEHLYNGRRLRPWLDAHFLDPGNLASNAELTTALDRSRVLGLVMSPEAMASPWVDFELRYYLGSNGGQSIIPILRRDCDAPAALPKGSEVLDFRGEALSHLAMERLVARLCPSGKTTIEDVEREVDRAFDCVIRSDPGGYAPDSSPERDAFLDALMAYDIDDAVSEGLAVAAFNRAGERLSDLSVSGAAASYNCKMLLGECLAAALRRSPTYRQVAQHFLDVAEEQTDGLALLFVVARAYSKLAELDLRLIDLSILLRTSVQLDAKSQVSNEEKALEGILARVIAKVRSTPAGELLIKTLCDRGRSSRVIAAGAISLSYKRSAPVFYLSEVQRLHERQAGQNAMADEPPSRKLLAELFALDLDQDQSVASRVKLAKQDLEHDFPGIDFPYGFFWGLQKRQGVSNLHNAPFTGAIVKATVSNMVELIERLDVASVACLTEPRIVDALFDNCGALLILQQDADSQQCRRLRDRGVPFGMLGPQAFAELSDGDCVVVDREHMTVMKAPMRRS